MVSVDGDTSTNDTLVVLANGLAENPVIAGEGADYETFKEALFTVMKALATIILPAIATLYITLAAIWGFGLANEVNATIEAIICFINALLGLFLSQSSKAYHKGD